MSTPQLGKLIKSKNALPDAIHIAIVPMIAGEYLYGGVRFRIAHGTKNVALRGDYNKETEVAGVVDPFLNDRGIEKGQRFWGLLFPGTVTGMRHLWEHPLFENKQVDKDEHETWLRNFCDQWNFDFDELITAGLATSKYKETWDRYVVAKGHDLHSAAELGEDLVLFWEHLEGYTGQKFSQDHKDGMGWSCTC